MADLLEQLENEATPKCPAPFDPDFRPAALWVKAYKKRLGADRRAVTIALVRPDGMVFHHKLEVLPAGLENDGANYKYVERTVKYLLWQKGANKVLISGCPEVTEKLAKAYAKGGEREFDADFMGRLVFLAPFEVKNVSEGEIPAANEPKFRMGNCWKGCRIGFDLGGSDRKCAAVIDGKIVHTEEVPWAPIKESDWHYQRDGILDSLKRAAAHLPRVDAIGGSSAGVYMNNEVRTASLFRGIPADDFAAHIRTLFLDIAKEWGVPLYLMNDGDVTALAGAIQLNDHPVLGMAFGTSLAGGYCGPDGGLTPWLNELAFVPCDFRTVSPTCPQDDWSLDYGCGAQYLSQQAVGRLAVAAGVEFKAECDTLPLRLKEMQRRLDEENDPVAADIFKAVGRFLGYTVAYANDFYVLKRFLALGRVTSGKGGDIIIRESTYVLETEFPEIASKVKIEMPDETSKRHGQAVIAATLPPDEMIP